MTDPTHSPANETLDLPSNILNHFSLLAKQLPNQKHHTTLLHLCVEKLPKLMASDRCSIFIHDPQQQRAWLHSGTGLASRELDIPLTGSISGEAMRTGKTINIANMQQRAGIHWDIDAMTGYQTRTVLCIPIMNSNQEEAWGTLQLFNKLNNLPFDQNDQDTLEKIGFQIRNAFHSIYYAQFQKRGYKKTKKKIINRIAKTVKGFFVH